MRFLYIAVNVLIHAHKYTNHLKTGLVWYSNGGFVSGCQMIWYSNSGLKTGLKKAYLWSKMSGIQMVCQVN